MRRSTVIMLASCVAMIGSVMVDTDGLVSRPLPHRLHQLIQPTVKQPQLSSQMDYGACSINGLEGECVDVSSCTGSSVQNLCPGADNIQCCIQQDEPEPGCGTAAINRAITWVNMEVQYCQAANGQPDADGACASVCNRVSNPAWDAYRSDCSGFVSYAFGLPPPGRVTGEFAPYTNDSLTFVLPNGAVDLAQGDVINSSPREHIMIFVGWLADDYSSARFLEEPGCSSSQPYARITDTAVEIQSDGSISLQSNGMNFIPIRFSSNSPVC